MAEDADDRASGYTVSVIKPEASEIAPWAKSDVELMVDGFGFMPKELSRGFLIRKGVPDDDVAGFDTLEEYFHARNPYFGATIGRYMNYIQDGTMVVKPSGRMYMLSTNKGHNSYHGGYVGFDKVNWRSYVTGNKVFMSPVAERFHEGYPGTVMAQVSFEVTCGNTIKIEMRCTTSKPTIVNLSNFPYLNFAGYHSGPDLMYDHIIAINADKYTAIPKEGWCQAGGRP